MKRCFVPCPAPILALPLYPPSPFPAFFPASIMGQWCNILDDSYAQHHARQCPDSCLGSWARVVRAIMPPGCFDLDMDSVDPFIHCNFCSFFCSHHRSRWRALHAVGFHHLAAGSQCNSFSSADVRDMDDRIVITREDMDNSPPDISWTHGFLASNFLLSGLFPRQSLPTRLWPRILPARSPSFFLCFSSLTAACSGVGGVKRWGWSALVSS